MRIFLSFLFSVFFIQQMVAGEYWGYHLILDCKGCDTQSVTSRENLSTFIDSLVDGIDMTAYGSPIIEHFAEHDPEAAGYSLVQLIETSSITGHFVDLTGEAYIDIFSCKYFDPEIAKKIVKEYFKPEKIKETYLERKA